jgi:hypothetical protein
VPSAPEPLPLATLAKGSKGSNRSGDGTQSDDSDAGSYLEEEELAEA